VSENPPKNFFSRATIAEDAKVLYALLDAAEAAGLLAGDDILTCWRDLKQRVDRSGYEPETEGLFNLLKAIDAAGLLGGSWIRLRWQSIRHRIDSAPRRMESRPASDRPPALDRRSAS
jgi:hypothetical protein